MKQHNLFLVLKIKMLLILTQQRKRDLLSHNNYKNSSTIWLLIVLQSFDSEQKRYLLSLPPSCCISLIFCSDLLIDISDVLQICCYELGRTYLKLSHALSIRVPAVGKR